MKQYINPFKLLQHFDTIYWCEDGIDIDTIKEMLDMVDEVYNMCSPLSLDYYDVDWHVARVKYFVNHPEKIDEITMYQDDISNGIIYDGNHRYVASIILGMTELPCKYIGDLKFFYEELDGIEK